MTYNAELSKTSTALFPGESELANLARLLRRDWKIVATATALVTLGAIAQVLLYRAAPRYVSDMMLLLYSKSADAEVTASTQVLTTQKGNLETEIALMRSQSLIAQAIQSLPPDLQGNTVTVEEVLSNLSIKQAGGTGVLTLSYMGVTPDQSEAVLNSLANTYIAYSLSRQKSESTKAIRLIERKLPQTGLALDQAATNLQGFRETYRLKDPENLADQLIGQRSNFENGYRQALVAYDKAFSEYMSLEEQLKQLGQTPQLVPLYVALSQDEIYNGLRQKQAQLKIDYEVNRARFSEINPLLEELAAEQASLKKSMEQRAQQLLGDNATLVDLETVSAYSSSSGPIAGLAVNWLTAQRQVAALNTELANLEATITSLEGDFQKVPRLQRQYSDLTREFNTQDKTMDYLLDSLQDLQIAEAQDLAPWEVLQPPSLPKEVPDPQVPSLSRNLVLGLLGGLLLGSSVVLLRDRFDNTFHSPEQLKDQANLPLLGVIPLRQQGQLRENYASGSVFSEAFRNLHTSLRLLRPDQPLRSLVVTSPGPGDGKSTVAAELAIAAASMGRQVLLVDLDLRRPSQAELFGLSSQQGFTTLINGDAELGQLLHTRASTPDLASTLPKNLTILLSGPRPPDPTQLLSSDKAQAWIRHLQDSYDLVIYDTPPVIGLADSLLIGPGTNGLALVTRMGVTQRTALYQTLDSLRASNMTILGIVANGYALSGRYAHYYYGHYNDPELAQENLDLARLIHKRLKKDRAKQPDTP